MEGADAAEENGSRKAPGSAPLSGLTDPQLGGMSDLKLGGGKMKRYLADGKFVVMIELRPDANTIVVTVEANATLRKLLMLQMVESTAASVMVRSLCLFACVL